MTLILARGVTHESIGNLSARIDWNTKNVHVTAKGGRALDPRELTLMKKYLSYHHRDIVHPSGLATGWTITGEIEVPLGSQPGATP